MNGVPIIVSNGQSIIILPMNHSLIPMQNNLESNKSKYFVIQHSRIQVWRILFLDTKYSGKFCDRQSVLISNNNLCECFRLKSSCSNIFIYILFFSLKLVKLRWWENSALWNFWRQSWKVTSQWTSKHQGCNQAMMLTTILLILWSKWLI